MSTSYPKVHVVGSGAYYSYRPLTRFIEKADRNHIREASSRPSDFAKYMSASSSRGPGYTRASVDRDPNRDRDFFRASSLPPFDTGREKKTSSQKEESFFKSSFNDPFFTDKGTESRAQRRRSHHGGHQETSTSSSLHSRRAQRSSLKTRTEDDSVLASDRNALFGTGEDVLSRLRKKHPYRLAVENEVVPPHESSIWPENRPHFDLVSSYDVMVDYLGIRDKNKK